MVDNIEHLRDDLEDRLQELQLFTCEQERLVQECRVLATQSSKLRLDMPRLLELCEQKPDHLHELEALRSSVPELVHTFFTAESDVAARLEAAILAFRSATGRKSDVLSLLTQEMEQLLEESRGLDHSCQVLRINLEQTKVRLREKQEEHQRLLDSLSRESATVSLWETENERMAVATGSHSLRDRLDGIRDELTKIDDELASKLLADDQPTPREFF